MRVLILAVLFAIQIFAQSGTNVPNYTAYKETSLSGAAETVTIRVPSTTNKSAFLLDGYVYCSVACTVTLEKNGTYSSGTTITPTPGRTGWAASSILATYGTSISSTTTIVKYSLAAGTDKAIDLRGIYLTEADDAFTIRTSSITGTAVIAVKWEQK